MTIYYTAKADGAITGWSDNREALIAQPGEHVVSTDREIVYGHDGRLYLAGEEPAPPPEILRASFVRAIQDRLDAFAQTRNYDSVFTAATYAASTNPKFAAEGQYCVEARDATWAGAYAILAEAEAGTRPMPGLEDIPAILNELPELAWPDEA